MQRYHTGIRRIDVKLSTRGTGDVNRGDLLASLLPHAHQTTWDIAEPVAGVQVQRSSQQRSRYGHANTEWSVPPNPAALHFYSAPMLTRPTITAGQGLQAHCMGSAAMSSRTQPSLAVCQRLSHRPCPSEAPSRHPVKQVLLTSSAQPRFLMARCGWRTWRAACTPASTWCATSCGPSCAG